MKTPHSNQCLHGALLPVRPLHPLRRYELDRRALMAGDALGHGLQAPRLTARFDDGVSRRAIPHVLHVDADLDTSRLMRELLAPEAYVTSVQTFDEARRLLAREAFALVVLDPCLPGGNAAGLLPLLGSARLLVYSRSAPDWHAAAGPYLAKPWTSARQLWIAVAGLLGLPHQMKAGA